MVNNFLLIYLDNIIAYSPDFETHLEYLEQVFQWIARYGLKLQPQVQISTDGAGVSRTCDEQGWDSNRPSEDGCSL